MQRIIIDDRQKQRPIRTITAVVSNQMKFLLFLLSLK